MGPLTQKLTCMMKVSSIRASIWGILLASMASPATRAGDSTEEIPTLAPRDTVFGYTWLGQGAEALTERKNEVVPISLGAWHWWRVGTGDPPGDGYGIPGLRGTYYWYLLFDPKITLNSDLVDEIGLHADVRLREQGRFRPFIDDFIWPWETYIYADTKWGVFKAGQIWKRFGLDWDGVFYGNTPYFDGFKLDPDLGVSWERRLVERDGFHVDSIAQFFIEEDGINGSIAGADPESTSAIREENTGVLRVVPTWTFDDGASFALGLSGSVGKLNSRIGDDETFAAWAIDMTYTKGNFSTFFEVLQSYGTLNPAHYVTGGPSDEITNYWMGASYATGPVTWRAVYSRGEYENPGGEQSLFLPGAVIALFDNMDLYIEYVNWDVQADGGPEVSFEDGMQFVINWTF